MRELTAKMNVGFWQDRPVLVTGCTGLLGAWLTRALVDLGALVVGLIRDEVPQSELVRSGTRARIRVVRGDVTDPTLVARTLNEYEVDAVFHLAAQTIVRIANRRPLSTFESNVRGTWTVLEAARQVSTVSRVVVASSDKAYGAKSALPYREDDPLRGRHPYDVSKSTADLIAQAYAHSYQLPVAITRCANLYGGGDLNWNRLIPGTIRSALQGETPIIRSDGSPRRDYLYVKDAVGAYLQLAEAMDAPEVCGEAFNCGTDAPVSVLEITRQMLSLVPGGADLELRVLGCTSNEIQDQWMDSGKLRRTLGWRPRWSRAAALRETIAWYADFLDVALPASAFVE